MVTNTAVVAAHIGGATPEQLSELYSQCSAHSKEVAFARAICDFAASGNIPDPADEKAAINALELLPPALNPLNGKAPAIPQFAVQCARTYQMEKKRALAAVRNSPRLCCLLKQSP